MEHDRNFTGNINRADADSSIFWTSEPSPLHQRPNILLIVLDDVGYAEFGCYGSEIETPALDSLAADGLRYANFYVTPLCSPTRTCLLTGGIAEETRISLEAGQPVFVLGGFGGCARDVAETVGLIERWFGSRDDWAGRDCFRQYSPDDLRNGLSAEENLVLARTPHIQEAVALVDRGLRRICGGQDADTQSIH